MNRLRVPSTDGVSVAVHDLGGSGPTLLLAHATGFCGRTLQPLADGLRDRFRCLSFDCRGHGDTETPAGLDFHWQGLADDALAVVDGLELERVFGFGHSAGGAALLMAEARRQGRFAALYCFEPIVWPEPDTGRARAERLAGGARRRRAEFASRDEAYANYEAKPPFSAFDRRALRAYVDHCLTSTPAGSVALKCAPETEASVYLGAAAGGFSYLSQVGCPVVVAAAGRHSALGPEIVGRQLAALQAGRLEEWPGLTHFGPLEDPEAVAAGITRALPGPGR